jgi:hypothetical protein
MPNTAPTMGDGAVARPAHFISTVLARTKGAAILLDDNNDQHVAETRDDVQTFFDAHPRGALSLVTAGGEVAGFALVHDDEGAAAAAREQIGAPSLVFTGDRIVTAWLLDEPCREADLETTLPGHEILLGVPVPGFAGYVLGGDSPQASDCPRYSLSELTAARPAGNPATASERQIVSASDLLHGLVLEAEPTFHGVLYKDQLDREITIAFAKRSDDRKWPNTTLKLGEFIRLIANHRTGKKEGACFTTGETAKAERTKNTIPRMWMLGIDVDGGTAVPAAIAALEKAEWLAMLYTTHSHLITTTRFVQTKYYAAAKKLGLTVNLSDADQVKIIFRALKPEASPEVLASISGAAETWENGPLHVVVLHSGIDKFRLLFPLEQPYEIQQAGRSQADTIRSWERKILGVAKQLELTADKACLDPSRLYYAPRHAAGHPFEVHVFGGKLLDLSTIAENDGVEHTDPFAAAGAEMAGADRDETYRRTKRDGIDLWAWNRDHGAGFEIADAIKENAPDLIRYNNHAERKLTLTCPFDDRHSNPGDPDDAGCYVQNASDVDDGTGFKFSCRDESCREFRKGDFLCKLIDDELLPASVLTDEDYNSIAPEEQTPPELHNDEWPEGYEVRGGKLCYVDEGADGKRAATPLCDEFHIRGAGHDENSQNWSVIIEFKDMAGHAHRISINRAFFQSKPQAIRERLAHSGLWIDGDRRAQFQLDTCLSRIRPKDIILTVSKPGWHFRRGDRIFVSPRGLAYDRSGLRTDVELSGDSRAQDTTEQGTLDDWKAAANIAARLNGPWALGICSGFAGTLVSLAEAAPCGMNLSGPSSLGKTTAQGMGTSAWVNPDYRKRGLLHRMSATSNALENLAALANGTTLMLDELGQVNPSELGKIIFDLAGGVGKSRQKSDSSLRNSAAWSMFFVFSSEKSIAHIMAGVRQKPLAGQMVRAIDYDVIEDLRMVTPDQFAAVEEYRRNFGHAGPAFVSHLFTQGLADEPERVRSEVQRYATVLSGTEARPQFKRAAAVLGYLWLAGELAKGAQLLDENIDVENAVRNAWAAFQRSPEAKALDRTALGLEALKHFLATHTGSDVVLLEQGGDSFRPVKAWYDDHLYYVPSENLSEIAGGIENPTAFAKELAEAGILKRPEKGKLVHQRVPKLGKLAHYRLIKEALFGPAQTVED